MLFQLIWWCSFCRSQICRTSNLQNSNWVHKNVDFTNCPNVTRPYCSWRNVGHRRLKLKSGWPDWTNFRPLFNLGSFLNYKATIIWSTLPTYYQFKSYPYVHRLGQKVILATFATIGIFALKINHLAIWTKLSGHEMQFFDCPAWRVNPGYFFSFIFSTVFCWSHSCCPWNLRWVELGHKPVFFIYLVKPEPYPD
jgi:hypothetical protein